MTAPLEGTAKQQASKVEAALGMAYDLTMLKVASGGEGAIETLAAERTAASLLRIVAFLERPFAGSEKPAQLRAFCLDLALELLEHPAWMQQEGGGVESVLSHFLMHHDAFSEQPTALKKQLISQWVDALDRETVESLKAVIDTHFKIEVDHIWGPHDLCLRTPSAICRQSHRAEFDTLIDALEEQKVVQHGVTITCVPYSFEGRVHNGNLTNGEEGVDVSEEALKTEAFPFWYAYFLKVDPSFLRGDAVYTLKDMAERLFDAINEILRKQPATSGHDPESTDTPPESTDTPTTEAFSAIYSIHSTNGDIDFLVNLRTHHLSTVERLARRLIKLCQPDRSKEDKSLALQGMVFYPLCPAEGGLQRLEESASERLGSPVADDKGGDGKGGDGKGGDDKGGDGKFSFRVRFKIDPRASQAFITEFTKMSNQIALKAEGEQAEGEQAETLMAFHLVNRDEVVVVNVQPWHLPALLRFKETGPLKNHIKFMETSVCFPITESAPESTESGPESTESAPESTESAPESTESDLEPYPFPIKELQKRARNGKSPLSVHCKAVLPKARELNQTFLQHYDNPIFNPSVLGLLPFFNIYGRQLEALLNESRTRRDIIKKHVDILKEAADIFKVALSQRLRGSMPYVQAGRNLRFLQSTTEPGLQLLLKAAESVAMQAVRENTANGEHSENWENPLVAQVFKGLCVYDHGQRGDGYYTSEPTQIINIPRTASSHPDTFWVIYHEVGHLLAHQADLATLIAKLDLSDLASDFTGQEEPARPNILITECFSDLFTYRYGFYGEWENYFNANIDMLLLTDHEATLEREKLEQIVARLFAVFLVRDHWKEGGKVLDKAEQSKQARAFRAVLKGVDAVLTGSGSGRPLFESLLASDAFKETQSDDDTPSDDAPPSDDENHPEPDDLGNLLYDRKYRQIYAMMARFSDFQRAFIPDDTTPSRDRGIAWLRTKGVDYLDRFLSRETTEVALPVGPACDDYHFPEGVGEQDIIWHLSPRELLFCHQLLIEKLSSDDSREGGWQGLNASQRYRLLLLLRGCYSKERKKVYAQMEKEGT
ncbi:MAG: hypothetical protein HQL50_09930 [Magnetococcales bacterium]|nr:hypothetical protein [Magnetococcales bacterium]